ncbi:MAG: GatB/YqeY domain-containing protein [Bdellovibrionales bacterium]
MLRAQITDTYKDAMRKKDERVVATVRLVMAELKKRDIDARPKIGDAGISEDEILGMLQGMIKQRRESIELYQKGNRADLVKQESDEIAVIERFLPKQLSEQEMKDAVAKTVTAIGAASIKDMGKVMAELKKNYAGQMDFAKVGPLVKEKLGG